jgi:ADP-ribose pyrophosphatase YjhB (NUDIX family)
MNRRGGAKSMSPHSLLESHGEWLRCDYSFCPKCGGRLARRALKASEPERLVCQSCRFVFFLDPKVAVGTIASLEGKLVLLKRGIQPGYGKWVFPGGFVDRGERVEEAAVRETREESHLDVRLTGLLNIYSYPDHPVIIIVYTAEVIGGLLAAGDETLDAGVFEPSAIPWADLAFPSTAQALHDYLARA